MCPKQKNMEFNSYTTKAFSSNFLTLYITIKPKPCLEYAAWIKQALFCPSVMPFKVNKIDYKINLIKSPMRQD